MKYREVDITDANFLYVLLAERTEDMFISHEQMPSYEEHRHFVIDHPYKIWAIVSNGSEDVGTFYITNNNEIYIQVLQEHHRKGYGTAIMESILIDENEHLRFYANINPQNKTAFEFLKSIGCRHIQNTYELCR